MAGMHNMLMGVGGGLVDTQTVTAKYFYSSDGKSGTFGPYYGYTTLGGGDSTISDNSSNIYAGRGFLDVLWEEPGTSNFRISIIGGAGSPVYNGGWSKITVTHTYSGTVRTFYRAAATSFVQFGGASDGNSAWYWNTPTNVFPNVTAGQNTYICRFYR